MSLEDQEPATRGDLNALESRVNERIGSSELRLNERMDAFELRLIERMETIETRLLTAFQQWAVPIKGGIRKLEAGDGVLDERLAMIEERLMTIEKRLGAQPQRPEGKN
jgi:hypothetical protein